ncbi:MAG TPA: ribonuclease R [Candidatus Deferrimicrobium sp.]|nr:ribonuclease R [Candidatus Deferrimicrobium sp.]
MPLHHDQIVSLIRSKCNRPMKLRELAKCLDIAEPDYGRFRVAVRELLDSGEMVRLKRNRLGLALQMDIAVGVISITRGGIGFVPQEKNGTDILISTEGLLTAFDGDKVMVRLGGTSAGRKTGAVIKILERASRNIVGTFHKARNTAFVHPDNPRFHRDLHIPLGATAGAEEGEKIVAALVTWDDPYLHPEGKVLERLGLPVDPGVDMLTVVKSFGLADHFPTEVIQGAEAAAAAITADELARRLDLTGECIYTIDPEDAKDHDDAISVRKTSGGYSLGVHIADVSHFVKSGTALDNEAFARGNSVYLPGLVLPMLPESLSSDLCSLRPHRKRLTYSVFIDFDNHGKMLSWRLADTVINSRAKLTYEEVQAFFDTGAAIPKVANLTESLLLARRLAQLLSAHRFAQGSLDFDLPEAKIILNKKGEVLELGHRVRLESHRLVEEFMLAANRAVALEVFRAAQPFLYRVHDRPDLEKLEAFAAMMARLGLSFGVSPEMKPLVFARFLSEVKDRPEADFINELMLRSMQKAVYQRVNIGHFGLAFTHYTHFTSPIRRYPDLLVHRLLRSLKNGRYPPPFARRVESVIDHVGQHCSQTERTAEAAERQAIKVKQVAFMARHVGDEFDGVISGVTSYGFFVRLDNMGVEGLVRMSVIDDDYYRLDEKQYRIVGRNTGRVFRLGDRVRVGVLKVDKIANEIDLHVARQQRQQPPAGRDRPRKRRSRRKSKSES